MVARTLPFKSCDKPDEELPSIAEEMQKQAELSNRISGNSLSTLSSK